MTGMRIPPIPRMMRADAVALIPQLPDGGWGEPVRIERCRVERGASLSPNAYQLTPGSTARVLIDATEYGGGIAEGDLLEFDGERHAAASVRRVDHPDGTPHHWEVDAR